MTHHVRHYGGGEYGIEGRYSELVRWTCRGKNEPGQPTIEPTPGMRWEPLARAWVGSVDAVDAAVRRLRSEGLEIDSSELGVHMKGPVNPVSPLRTRGKGFRPLWPFQIEGANWILERSEEGCLLADEQGLGKQQPIDSLVLTPVGYRPIGELRVGDLVIGSSGAAVKVTGVFPQGRRPSYRINLGDGSSVEAGDEHLWTVFYWRGGKSLAPLVLTTKQLRERPRVGQLDLKKTALYVPLLKSPAKFKKRRLPFPPYTLGALLANGGLTHDTRVTVNAADAKEIIHFIRRERVPVGSINTYGNATHINLVNVRGPLYKLHLMGKSNREKRVPPDYLLASVKDRIALLHGLMDGDGSCSKTRNRLVYHSINEGLAQDVQALVEQLGGVATLRQYDRTREGKPIEYRVQIRLPKAIAPFRARRKLSRYHPGNHAHPTRRVLAVDYVRDVQSVCIAVDATDQLYVTEHAILTHNTAQFLRAARALRHRGRACVVVPNFVKGSWRTEAKEWWPEVEIVVLEGTNPNKRRDLIEKLGDPPPKDGQLVIVNYDILHAWVSLLTQTEAEEGSNLFAPPVILGFDEAQFLQSEKSRRSKAARALARAVRFRVAMTGTPPTDRPKDLWNLVDTISEGRFGGFFPFGLRYCAAHRVQVTREKTVWDFKGASNLDELQRRMGFFMLRRTQKEVALDLPSFRRQIVPVEVQRGHRAPLMGAVVSDVAMRRALDLASDGKIPSVIDLARTYLEGGHRIVVFTFRRAVAEEVAGAFGDKADFIHGGIDQKKRDEVLDSRPQLLAATLDTGGVGINKLVHYDVAIFAELHWIPSTLAQAEKRLHRPGQTRPVLIVYVIAEGTADELIRDGCIKKLQTRAETLGKLDDGLLEELDGEMRKSGASALRALAESLVA